jgi:hypothetical protein
MTAFGDVVLRRILGPKKEGAAGGWMNLMNKMIEKSCIPY